ncbi:hypothetical protein ACP70R_049493 [Stipagrostis hirtigluma subsp. patula]
MDLHQQLKINASQFDHEVMSADVLYAAQTAHVQNWIIYHQTFRRSSPLKSHVAMEDMMATVLVLFWPLYGPATAKMEKYLPVYATSYLPVPSVSVANTDHIVGNKVFG